MAKKIIRYIAAFLFIWVPYIELQAQSLSGTSDKYTVQLEEYTSSVPQEDLEKLMKVVGVNFKKLESGNTIYTVGDFNTIEEANIAAGKYKEQGFLNATVILNGTNQEIIIPGATAYNSNPVSKKEYQDSIVKKDITNNIIVAKNQNINSPEGKYAVLLGKFVKNVPFDVIDKFLSLPDAINTKIGDTTYYTSKIVSSIQEAQARIAEVKLMGFDKAYVVEFGSNSISAIHVPSLSGLVQNPPPSNINTAGLIFRVQLAAVTGKGTNQLFTENGISDVISFSIEGFTKYYSGAYTTYQEAKNHKIQMQQKGFADAFISAYKDGKRIEIAEAIKMASGNNTTMDKKPDNNTFSGPVYKVQLAAFKDTVPSDQFAGVKDIITEPTENGYIRVLKGNYTSYQEAKANAALFHEKGFIQAFVVAYKDNKRISLQEASVIEK